MFSSNLSLLFRPLHLPPPLHPPLPPPPQALRTLAGAQEKLDPVELSCIDPLHSISGHPCTSTAAGLSSAPHWQPIGLCSKLDCPRPTSSCGGSSGSQNIRADWLGRPSSPQRRFKGFNLQHQRAILKVHCLAWLSQLSQLSPIFFQFPCKTKYNRMAPNDKASSALHSSSADFNLPVRWAHP